MKNPPKLSKHAAVILAGAVADRDALASKPVTPHMADWYAAPILEARDFDQVRLNPAQWLGRDLTPSDYVANNRAYKQLERLGLAERASYEGSTQTSFLTITAAGLELGRRLLGTNKKNDTGDSSGDAVASTSKPTTQFPHGTNASEKHPTDFNEADAGTNQPPNQKG